MRRIVVILAVAMAVLALAVPSAIAQYSIVDSSPVLEDFDGFTGAGFSPTPSPGQLDSNQFAVTGLSDGDLGFGATGTGGDFARGASAGGVTTGGVYAFNGSDTFLFIQPTGDDFTPGALTMRYRNDSGVTITDLDVSYSIMTRNDQARSNSWNFSFAPDCSSFSPVPSLLFNSPEVADPSPTWVVTPSSVSLPGLSIPDGALFCLRFESDDVSGSGSRDEIGIDKVSVAASNVPVELQSFRVD